MNNAVSLMRPKRALNQRIKESLASMSFLSV